LQTETSRVIGYGTVDNCPVPVSNKWGICYSFEAINPKALKKCPHNCDIARCKLFGFGSCTKPLARQARGAVCNPLSDIPALREVVFVMHGWKRP